MTAYTIECTLNVPVWFMSSCKSFKGDRYFFLCRFRWKLNEMRETTLKSNQRIEHNNAWGKINLVDPYTWMHFTFLFPVRLFFPPSAKWFSHAFDSFFCVLHHFEKRILHSASIYVRVNKKMRKLYFKLGLNLLFGTQNPISLNLILFHPFTDIHHCANKKNCRNSRGIKIGM